MIYGGVGVRLFQVEVKYKIRDDIGNNELFELLRYFYLLMPMFFLF